MPVYHSLRHCSCLLSVRQCHTHSNNEGVHVLLLAICCDHDTALQTCTRTGKRGVTSVLVMDVLASTGNILEVVVTLVASITTESTMTNTILGTLERCAKRCEQLVYSGCWHFTSLHVSYLSVELLTSNTKCAGWYEAFQHPEKQVPLPNCQPRQALESCRKRGMLRGPHSVHCCGSVANSMPAPVWWCSDVDVCSTSLMLKLCESIDYGHTDPACICRQEKRQLAAAGRLW